MSASRSKLKLPDGQFIAYANTIDEQCTENATPWNIDPLRLHTLNTLTVNANHAFTANSDRAKHNHMTSTNKKMAFGELKHFLSPFIDFLEGNLLVPDSALENMNLRPRVHHAHLPIGRPTDIPAIKILQQHDELTVYVFRSELGQPTQSTTQPEYAGFKMRWRFEGETVDRIEVSTRLHHTIFLDREDETKRIILAAAFINPRLEEGPWSGDVVVVIG
jgi:hypothetical protein